MVTAMVTVMATAMEAENNKHITKSTTVLF